jgi:hypothetical protein
LWDDSCEDMQVVIVFCRIHTVQDVDARMFEARIVNKSIIPDGMVYCENGRIDQG